MQHMMRQMKPYALLLTAATLTVSGCTDTTAVKNFASESSVLTENASVLNGGDTAYKAVGIYMKSAEMRDDPQYRELLQNGPGTPAYEDSKKLAPKAAAILQAYMTAIGKLAGDTTVIQTNDVTGAVSSLKTLGIASAEVQPALDAAGKLGNLVVQGYANEKLQDIVSAANPYVQTLAHFLAAFAKRNAAVYDAARVVSGVYWTNLITACQSPSPDEAKAKSRKASLRPPTCDAVVALSVRMHALEEDTLKKPRDATDAARTGFDKIATDHQAIVDSDGKFDAKQLIDTLKADEPTLVAAIKDLSKL
jgi:hypothetical protein